MSADNPANIEPSINTTIPKRKNALRPYISDSFPTIGIMAVDATKYDVVTHEKRSKPPREATIFGIAVATIV